MAQKGLPRIGIDKAGVRDVESLDFRDESDPQQAPAEVPVRAQIQRLIIGKIGNVNDGIRARWLYPLRGKKFSLVQGFRD